jgi:proteasome assembly chaperone (PAC2) family protein
MKVIVHPIYKTISILINAIRKSFEIVLDLIEFKSMSEDTKDIESVVAKVEEEEAQQDNVDPNNTEEVA